VLRTASSRISHQQQHQQQKKEQESEELGTQITLADRLLVLWVSPPAAVSSVIRVSKVAAVVCAMSPPPVVSPFNWAAVKAAFRKRSTSNAASTWDRK